MLRAMAMLRRRRARGRAIVGAAGYNEAASGGRCAICMSDGTSSQGARSMARAPLLIVTLNPSTLSASRPRLEGDSSLTASTLTSRPLLGGIPVTTFSKMPPRMPPLVWLHRPCATSLTTLTCGKWLTTNDSAARLTGPVRVRPEAQGMSQQCRIMPGGESDRQPGTAAPVSRCHKQATAPCTGCSTLQSSQQHCQVLTTFSVGRPKLWRPHPRQRPITYSVASVAAQPPSPASNWAITSGKAATGCWAYNHKVEHRQSLTIIQSPLLHCHNGQVGCTEHPG
jgi:hypothetical protein